MARKIKFPLKMKDGYDARSIEELREHFDLESVLGYFADGRLQTWLRDRYFDDEAQQVSELDPNDSELVTKICNILGVEAPEHAVNVDVHEINRYNEKRKLLLEKYPEPELLNNIDAVAFNEDDIIQIIEKGIKEIYLIDNEFEFPFEISDGKIVKKDGSPLPADIGISLYDCIFIGKEAKLHIDTIAIRICKIFRIQFEKINFIFVDEGVELVFKGQVLKDVNTLISIASHFYDSKDYKLAFDNYLIAAELGNPFAQGMLGQMYFRGLGVNRDSVQAAEWYRKAAEQGHAGAQCCLGAMYSNGEGVTKDKTKAVEWLRKAAEQRNALAQFNLGVIYSEGEGVEKDYAKAAEWYEKAAEQGNEDAKRQLGVMYKELGIMYKEGKDVKKNIKLALDYLNKASEQGNYDATLLLATMYSLGEDVETDFKKSHKYMERLNNQI